MLMSPRRTHGDAGEHLGPQMQEGKDPEYQRRGKKGAVWGATAVNPHGPRANHAKMTYLTSAE